jgi:tRNA dimethylallyltransferase
MPAHFLIILTGPTAVGKTPLAILLAKHLGTEIINADSRQVYREMRIGTAHPAIAQQAEIKHHLIGHRSIHEHYNASLYERDAMKLIYELFEKYEVVIMSGGSGMYIDAVCRGIDDIPTVDPEVRERLHSEFLAEGLRGIQARLLNSDPEYYKRADLNNPKRLLKALEITEMTGKPYSSFLTGTAKQRDFSLVRLGLNMPRDELHDRINRRVDKMMAEGLLDEVNGLYPYRQLNALNTVGYKEIFDFMDHKYSLDEAVELIKGHTRQYARRQLTWFRRNKETHWFMPDDIDVMLRLINKKMKQDEPA